MISSSIPTYIASVASNTAEGAVGGFGVPFVFALEYMSTPEYVNSPLPVKVSMAIALPVVLTVTTVAGGVMGFVGGVLNS